MYSDVSGFIFSKQKNGNWKIRLTEGSIPDYSMCPISRISSIEDTESSITATEVMDWERQNCEFLPHFLLVISEGQLIS